METVQRAVIVLLAASGCGRFGFDASAPDAAQEPDADVEAVQPCAGGPPSADLLAWYRFELPDTTIDWSGAGLDGNCGDELTCPLPAEGALGGGLQFQRSRQDRLRVRGPLDLSGDFTAMGWVFLQPAAMLGSRTIAAKMLGADDSNTVQFGIREGGGLFISLDSLAGRNTEEIAESVAEQTWSHVAVAYSPGSSTAFVWLNGVRISTLPGIEVDVDDGPLLLGADLDADIVNDTMNGVLDDLRFYRRLVSDSEVAALVACAGL